MQSELQIELNRRDKKRYLEELSELESKLSSYHSKIFWATLNLLIIEPAIAAGTVYYLWGQFTTSEEELKRELEEKKQALEEHTRQSEARKDAARQELYAYIEQRRN